MSTGACISCNTFNINNLQAGVGIGLNPRFSYEENMGFPSERQELFALTRHYFSVLFQYFH